MTSHVSLFVSESPTTHPSDSSRFTLKHSSLLPSWPHLPFEILTVGQLPFDICQQSTLVVHGVFFLIQRLTSVKYCNIPVCLRMSGSVLLLRWVMAIASVKLFSVSWSLDFLCISAPDKCKLFSSPSLFFRLANSIFCSNLERDLIFTWNVNANYV